MIPACVVVSHELALPGLTIRTWIMKMIMGFLESYREGSPPSKIPPCGGALAVLSVTAPVTVVVTRSVTVVVNVAILVSFVLAAWEPSVGCGTLVYCNMSSIECFLLCREGK